MMSDATKQRIEERAYRIWLQQGQPEGHALDHWIEAEQQESTESTDGEKEKARDASIRSVRRGTEKIVKRRSRNENPAIKR